MINRFGLTDDVIEKIQHVLSQFPDIKSVILYGSRAKGNYKTGSDIDLSLKTNNTISDRLLFRVISALDDLDLPYTFDVSLFEQIDNVDLREHIDRVGVDFFRAK